MGRYLRSRSLQQPERAKIVGVKSEALEASTLEQGEACGIVGVDFGLEARHGVPTQHGHRSGDHFLGETGSTKGWQERDTELCRCAFDQQGVIAGISARPQQNGKIHPPAAVERLPALHSGDRGGEGVILSIRPVREPYDIRIVREGASLDRSHVSLNARPRCLKNNCAF